MNIIYDLMGSIIVGGMILLMILGFNANLMDGAATQTFTTTVQSNLTTVSDIVEFDFKKIAYGIIDPTDSVRVTYIDTNRIDFRGDINDDGVVDQVSYVLDPTPVAWNDNPNTRILYRTINGGARQAMDLGLTRFKLTFYNASGASLTGNTNAVLSKIRSIKVAMTIQSKTSFYDQRLNPSKSAYYNMYSGGYWERIIRPKNLD